MIVLRKMMKNDVLTLYDMALRSFHPDYNKYGFYPPLIKEKTKSFLPPLLFGKVILADDTIIGGAFVVGIGKKGEIGTIFIDPVHQKKGYGKQAMFMIEKLYEGLRGFLLDGFMCYILHKFASSFAVQDGYNHFVRKFKFTACAYLLGDGASIVVVTNANALSVLAHCCSTFQQRSLYWFYAILKVRDCLLKALLCAYFSGLLKQSL